MIRVHLIHWKIQEHPELIEKLQSLGYQVESDLPQSPAFFRELAANLPDVLVIDLSRLPSQGRDLAINMRSRKAAQQLPIIFVDGSPEKVSAVRQVVPDAICTSWSAIASALQEARDNPPETQLRSSAFAGYAGTALIKKLGIKAGMQVVLLQAPQDMLETLGELPHDVRVSDEIRPGSDLILWFVRQKSELEAGLTALTAHCREHNSKAWICWPKQASGMQTDITQNVVREQGLASGLVDYKIASIDRTWSALLFTWRG